MAQHDDSQDLRAINLRLSAELVERIDQLKGEFGLRSRGAIVERLLSHLFTDPDLDDEELLGDAATAEELDAAAAENAAAPDAVSIADPTATLAEDPLSAGRAAAEPADGSGATHSFGDAAVVRSTAAGEAEQLVLDAPSPLDASSSDVSESSEPNPASTGAGDAASGAEMGRAAGSASGCFDESSALVLVARGGGKELVLDLALPTESAGPRGASARSGGGATATAAQAGGRSARGIDLPGFVRRQSDQLRRSLHPRRSAQAVPSDPLPIVAADRLEQALARATGHWIELYGSEPNEAVLEASMIWLAQDIWPQSDQCEGRPFSWSLVQQVMSDLSPAWPQAPATFARVMVAAGILEDPFSVSTLDLRIPTLIRRFVHRFRRRRPGTSFQTLEHTMTLHGALRLLQLPTTPGQRLTLPQIREAYREMALAHHPDAGGSEESMRRLNEAYQLLKELYRTI